ncbi:MAG TPA: TadE family protein [Microbacterium sp.]|nr:TadE family protein [Microbacterium sp.]HKT57375.1 TadE family protein [Microbacterium sp.]
MRRILRGARRRFADETGPADRGSSPVEFVLVGAMLTILTLGVLQLGLGVYVRNVVHDAAVEGAYHAALADNDPADGVAWTRRIIERTVGAQYADRVEARRTGADVRVTVRTTLPVIGLLGVAHAMEVIARAPVERLD